ncbi:MAG TPA: hypothetical protein VL199_17255 [Burkholderiales bacterium]|nr:hypothetical protein [Burkholderiales bacterium]
MAALERTKEEVAYLKLWQGIVVVTDISLAGWTISASVGELTVIFAFGVAGVLLLGVGAIVLHRQIEAGIAKIGMIK